MGRRPKPKHLAKKLLAIRRQLGVSQTEMAKLLELRTAYTDVSRFERGVREPPLPVLLRYARLAGVCMDILADDKLKLTDVPH